MGEVRENHISTKRYAYCNEFVEIQIECFFAGEDDIQYKIASDWCANQSAADWEYLTKRVYS